jgi:hypothetical protein
MPRPICSRCLIFVILLEVDAILLRKINDGGAKNHS